MAGRSSGGREGFLVVQFKDLHTGSVAGTDKQCCSVL